MNGEPGTMATPLEISTGLWYYTRPGDYGLDNGDRNFNAPAVRETFKRFVDAGLLCHCSTGEQNYKANEPALKAWVEALCSVPFPVVKWVVEPQESHGVCRR
jgi:hypothetical protein